MFDQSIDSLARVARLLLLSIATLLTTERLSGQTLDSLRWEWKLAEPTGNIMNLIHFFDRENGIAAGESGNILRTTDGGLSWRIVMSAQPWEWEKMAVADESTLWLIGDPDQLWVTHDRGATWSSSATPVDTWVVELQFIDDRTAYAVDTGKRILRTDDGGVSWSDVADARLFPFTSSPVYRFLDDTLWLMGNHNGDIKRSTDAGTTWTDAVRLNNSQPSSILEIRFVDEALGYAVSYGGQILRTTDRGMTWDDTLHGSRGTIRRTHSLGDGMVAFTGDDKPGFSWDDGMTWRADSANPWRRSIINAITGIEGVIWATGNDGVLFRSADTGRTWQSPYPTGRVRLNDVVFVDDRLGFSGGEYDSPYKMSFTITTDGGETWTTDPRTLEWYSVYDIEIVGTHIWVIADDAAIYHSPDLGATWETQSKKAVNADLHTIDFADSLHGFALGTKSLLRTTDGGAFWEILAHNEPNVSYNDLSVLSADTAWVTRNSMIRRTTDGGETWTDMTMEKPIKKIQFLDARNGWSLMIDNGILRTTDGGASWESSYNGGATFTTFHFHDTLNGVALVYTHTWTTSDGGETWVRYPNLNGRIPARAAFTNEHSIWVAALGGILHAERRIVTAVAPSRQPLAAPRVRPIPAVDHVVLEGLPEERGRWRVTIHSAVGETVRAIDDVPADGSSLRIMIGELPAGVYVVRIENEITGSVAHARVCVL